MRSWIDVLWVSLLVIQLACAGKVITVEAPEIANAPAVNTDKTLQLIGRSGIAQACPVAGVIYTAAHVVQHEDADGKPGAWVAGYAFSTAEGNEGVVVPAYINAIRDIAVLYPKSGAVNYYKLGPTPESGSKVFWREYDFKDIVLDKVLAESEVLHLLAGHVIMANAPKQGASGGCLFNEEGEVIGIAVWSVSDGGVTVSITGFWNPFK